MRSIISIFFICLVLAFSAQAQNAKRYAIKSGYLKLELTGSTKGYKELWWDNYGAKTCELEKSTSTTKIFGISNVEQNHKLTIINKDKYWTVDYTDDSGAKGTVPYYNENNQVLNEMTPAQQDEMADEILKQMGGQHLGTEKLGSYSCEIISILGAKSWIYNGIILKSETSVMGIKNYEKYSEFKPNVSVSASKFVAPSNVSYRNMQSSQQQAMSSFPIMEMDEDESSNEDENNVPVKYPLEKFKAAVTDFSYPGYVKMGVNSMDGIHAASFIKGMMGMGGTLLIVAESKQNAEPNEHDSFEKFTHNGHTCYFGEMEDEDGTALVIEYNNYDMYIIIAGIPDLSKSELIRISDKLKF